MMVVADFDKIVGGVFVDIEQCGDEVVWEYIECFDGVCFDDFCVSEVEIVEVWVIFVFEFKVVI